MECPVHKTNMQEQVTKYGLRFSCPDCDMVGWEGDNSTPANKTTRDARMAAHSVFDKIWRNGHIKRSDAYKRLSKRMKLPQKDTHIGMFNEDQCQRVIEFAETLPLVLLKEKYSH
jgi:hypothetical protein